MNALHINRIGMFLVLKWFSIGVTGVKWLCKCSSLQSYWYVTGVEMVFYQCYWWRRKTLISNPGRRSSLALQGSSSRRRKTLISNP